MNMKKAIKSKPLVLKEEEYKLYRDEYAGFCRICWDITNECGVEPDAERYDCDWCGHKGVYGIEQALMYGWIIIEEEGEINEKSN